MPYTEDRDPDREDRSGEGRAHTPSAHLPAADILLSYPQSGGTWLGHLYVHYAAHRLVGPGAEEFLARHFSSIPLEPLGTPAFHELVRTHEGARLVPSIYTRLNLDTALAQLTATPAASAGAAVLLVRDPRDVLVSHYHHLRAQATPPFHPDVDLSEFVRSEIWGIRAVVACMNQAITLGPARFSRFHVLHFEEMCADPARVLALLLDAIGACEIDPDAIRRAAESATAERLQQLERSSRATEGESLLRHTFRFRGGRVGSCLEELAAPDLVYLDQVIARTLSTSFERYRAPVQPARRDRKAVKLARQLQARRMFERISRLKGIHEDEPFLVDSERARTRAQDLHATLDEVIETTALLDSLARSGRPIIVGPWVTEPGFELLYWIPFLNWVVTQFDLDPGRVIAVSRGGAASWYQHLAGRYLDIFDFFPVEEFRSRSSQIVEGQGVRKHVALSDFDREILERVRLAGGLTEAAVLHPSVMFTLFQLFWGGYTSIGLVQGHTLHRRLPRPDLDGLAAHVPADYVAVKFYGRASFPETPGNQAFVRDCLDRLAAEHDVVLLHTGVLFDQHHELRIQGHPRIHSIAHLMTPRNNLDVQTRIIGNARAFVGTYGGFSYLAPLCGVDALSFYSDPAGFRADHLDVATRAFTGLEAGSLMPLDVRKVELVRIGLGSGETLVTGATG